ncbi:MAG: fibronectin type III domain-containing protein, partial [Planctomycetota bacterium]
MRKVYSLIIAAVFLALTFGTATLSGQGTFEYPYHLIDAYDADDSCWTGMDANGVYHGPIMVVPEQWLVGPPLSDMSGVTLPPDHWVELLFRGQIIDGPGDDIKLIELGPVNEQALIFLTDGTGQERLINIATSGTVGSGVDPTYISFDIAGIDLPFEPRAIRILGLDNGGLAPGFDIANIQARIRIDSGEAACNPIPADGAKNVPTDAILSWSTGQNADKHIVHFGTDLTNIGASAGGPSEPPQLQDANTFDPGDLELGTTYYWRIDEVNDQNVWPGEVWSFTTIDHFVVDDFEQYNDSTGSNRNRIFDTWKSINVSLSIDHSHKCGKKSMITALIDYNTAEYSNNIFRTFNPPQDWTAAGAKALELFFSDRTENSHALIYIALNDGNNETIVLYPRDSNDITNETWHPWRIDLQELQDIDLRNIESIAIGFYPDPNYPSGGGNGSFFFDDIRLYSPRCLEENIINADFNSDCLVNFEDFEETALNWLETGYKVYPVAAPNRPVSWYEFEYYANDSAGRAHGRTTGKTTYTQGVYGLAINFDGNTGTVLVENAADTFSKIDKAITIAFWQKGADSPYHTDTLFCTNYTYGGDDPAIAINLGCWRRPGKYHWDCGSPWSFDNKLSGYHRYPVEWYGRWNHWAFTKDAETGV